MAKSPAWRLDNLDKEPKFKALADRVAKVEASGGAGADPRVDALIASADNLREEMANLQDQLSELAADQLVDDEDINLLQQAYNQGELRDATAGERIKALEDWRAAQGNPTPLPPPPEPTDPPPADGIARNDKEFRALAAALKAGGTIVVRGQVDTVGAVLRQPGFRLVFETGARLRYKPALGGLAWDKGLVVANLLPELRGLPSAERTFTIERLAGQDARHKDGGALLRVDVIGPEKAMWGGFRIEGLDSTDCDFGFLGGGEGDKYFSAVRGTGWGKNGKQHLVYVNVQGAKHAGRTFVDGLYSRNGSEGHPFKCRDGVVVTENFDVKTTGNESYEDDGCCQGGYRYIANSTFWQHSVPSANRNVMAFGEERGKHGRYADAIPAEVRARLQLPDEVTEVLEFGPGVKLMNTGEMLRDRWIFWGANTDGKPQAFVRLVGFDGVEKVLQAA